jgi:hypothetical protein
MITDEVCMKMILRFSHLLILISALVNSNKLFADEAVTPPESTPQISLGAGVIQNKDSAPGLRLMTNSPLGLNTPGLQMRLPQPDYMNGTSLSLSNPGDQFVSRPCRDKAGNVKSEFIVLSKSSVEINRAAACSDYVANGGYDTCSCGQYEACTKSVLGIDNFFGFKKTQQYQDIVQPFIGEVLANKYAENMLKKSLSEIEERKLMRKYAEKLGLEITAADKCEDKIVNDNCSKTELDSTINYAMKSCNLSSNYTCHKLEDASYKDLDMKADEKKLKFDVFLNNVAESKAIEALTNEVTTSNELAEIFLVKDTKKKAPVKDLKVLVQQMKEKLNQLAAQKKLDPVLLKIKNNDKSIEEFVSKIKEKVSTQKSPTLISINEAFTGFKKSKIDEYFSDSKCESAQTLQRICSMKTAIATGDKSLVNTQLSSSQVSEIFNDDDMDKAYEDYKAKNFYRIINNKNEYAAMMKGYRCFMFVYANNYAQRNNAKSCGAGSNVPEVYSQSVYNVKNSRSESSDDDRPSDFKAEKSKDNVTIVDISKSLETNKKVEEDLVGADKIEAAKQVDLNKAMSDSLNNNFNSNPANFDTSTVVDTASKIADEKAKKEQQDLEEKAKKEADSTVAVGSSIEEKMRELNKKIAAAEESLEKMKAAKKESDAEAEKKIKDDSVKALENQIKELRGELSVAKQKAATVVTEKVEAPVQKAIGSASANPLTTSVRDSSEERPRGYVKPKESNSSEGSEVSRPVGSLNQANLPQGGGAIGASKSSGLVLTKVDGLTTEAFVETISSKIAEMKGQPFLIEEGGFVKEIIPVLKDGKVVLDEKGKPVFEKIIKGKVADLKNKAAAKAQSTVVNQADLRKAEEAKVKAEQDRLKYKSLKDLTDKAVK